jgi:hypothetical protein
MKVRCILRGPGGELSWMLFQEGRSSNLRLRRGVGQAAHTRNNPHVKSNGGYCAWIVNNAFRSELYWVQISGSLAPSLTFNIHWSSSFIQSCWSPFEIFCRMQLEHKAATVTYITLQKLLARQALSSIIPCQVCLLRNKSVNKHCELQKGEDSAQCNEPMTDIKYMPQYCRKKKSINTTATIFINYTTGGKVVSPTHWPPLLPRKYSW